MDTHLSGNSRRHAYVTHSERIKMMQVKYSLVRIKSSQDIYNFAPSKIYEIIKNEKPYEEIL